MRCRGARYSFGHTIDLEVLFLIRGVMLVPELPKRTALHVPAVVWPLDLFPAASFPEPLAQVHNGD